MRQIDLRLDPAEHIPRPDHGEEPVEEVRAILQSVRERGDEALIELTEKFDGVHLDVGALIVGQEEVEKAAASVPAELTQALEEAERRIRAVAQNQMMMPWREEIAGGTVGEVVHPVERAGIYVPGGRAAYPSTVLMCAVPASVAGVTRIAMCVPPGPDGSVPAPTLAAASVAGIDEVYRVGGAQAIAAMAYGTETIPAVDVIVGPGNRYVALAKKEVAGTVGIESIAGPSEIAILADETADPRIIALDLAAQAEHGPGGSFLLVTWDEGLADSVRRELEGHLPDAITVLTKDRQQAVEAVTRFAPEHLQILCEDAEHLVDQIRNVGAIFVGPWSPVALGDYLAGSNHVLPTGGSARWASGLRASHFQRAQTVVWYEQRSLESAAGMVGALTDAEGFAGHRRAVEARLEER